MNIAKGLMRIFIVIWLMWIAFGISSHYKELATYIGYERWTELGVTKESNEICENAKKIKIDDINCYSIPEFITIQHADYIFREFSKIFVIMPLLLILLMSILFYSYKWIIQGFKK